MALTRKRVLYSGRVQGVGFRITAQTIAQRHPVAGYVRNLPSGQVELMAQGEIQAVSAFLTALEQRMQENIASTEVEEQAPDDDQVDIHSGFTIRY